MANTNFIDQAMNTKNKGLIICGTDTDVGKTIASAMLVNCLEATYWKPIQSGLEDGGDTGRVRQILNLPNNRYLPESYKFKAAVSPHWAAEQENIEIELSKLKIPQGNNFLIIETAGGLLVPITRKLIQIDLIKKWNLPVLLIARSGLGTINHTLLSIEALRRREIRLIGVILNGPPHKDNPKTIEEIGLTKVLGIIPPLKKIDSESLSEEWHRQDLGINLKKLLLTKN